MDKLMEDTKLFILNQQRKNRFLNKLFTHTLSYDNHGNLVCYLWLDEEFKFNPLDRELVFNACINNTAKNQMVRQIVAIKYRELPAMKELKNFMTDVWKFVKGYTIKGKKANLKCRLDFGDVDTRRYIAEMDSKGYYIGYERSIMMMNYKDFQDHLTPEVIQAIDYHPKRFNLKHLLIDGKIINDKWDTFGTDVIEISKLANVVMLFKINDNKDSMWYLNLNDGVVNLEKYQ